MSPRREYIGWLGVLTLGAVGVLATSSLPWTTVLTDDASLGASARRLDLSGTALAPALSPLALVALAGVVGVLASRAATRRLVGGVILLAGSGLVWAVVDARFGTAALTRAARSATGSSSVGVFIESWAATWCATFAFGVLVCAAGVATVLRAGQWPTLSDRYERGGEPAQRRRASGQDAWSQLDRGEDPTDGPSHPLRSEPDLTQSGSVTLTPDPTAATEGTP